MIPDWLVQMCGYLVAVGAVYGGIRADLREIHRRIARLEAIEDERASLGRRAYDHLTGAQS